MPSPAPAPSPVAPHVSIAGITSPPDAAAIDAAARGFTSIGTTLDQAMDTLDVTWGGLNAPRVYETPESAHVHDAMHGPRQAAHAIGQDAMSTRSALQTYAQSIADLAARRTALIDDIGSANRAAAIAAEGPDADCSKNATVAEGLVGRIAALNAAVEAADADCAATLRRLARYTRRELGEVADALHDFKRTGGVIGVAGSLMTNYDNLKDALIGELEVWGFLESRGRHVAVQSMLSPVDENARVRGLPGAGTSERSEARHLGTADGLGGVSRALRYGGRALGAAGVVATIGGAYLDSYNTNTVEHPEWSETHKNRKATEHAAVTGGVSAVGGVAGGLLGAEMGASLGSIVPGVGTVVGGILGGLVGGIIGSGIGEKMGEGAEELMDKLFHW